MIKQIMWTECSRFLPPQDVAVLTKIDNKEGVRNEQKLLLHRNLWFFPDMSMYVYYKPTHWAYCEDG